MAKKDYINELFRFSYFPNYDGSVRYLAEDLADPEDEWDFSGVTKKNTFHTP